MAYDDLVQQTRSANAAEEVVHLTCDQTRLAAFGTVVALFTLIAAGAAALYAKDAAKETKRTADTADKALHLTETTAKQQLRAYIDFSHAKLTITPISQSGFVAINIKFSNAGQTPARNVKCAYSTEIVTFPFNSKPLPAIPVSGNVMSIGSGSNLELFESSLRFLRPEEWIPCLRPSVAINCIGQIRYDDVFGEPHRIEFRLMYGGNITPTDDQMCLTGEYIST